MTHREIILQQIKHRETAPVPYTLGSEKVIGEQLDQHYGDESWRQRIRNYMSFAGFQPFEGPWPRRTCVRRESRAARR